MTDRLTSAFNALRAGGAVFAGRARLTGWSDSSRGMLASFRLDASDDVLDNPATHPFKGAHCSPKDGHEFMVLVIPVANTEEAAPDTGSSNGRTPDFDSGNAGSTPAPVTTPQPERRKWNELPLSQRAAMLCEDKLFWQFISDRFHAGIVWSGNDAATFVRSHCRVKSRTDLNTDQDAGMRFDRLCRDFWAWKNEPVSPAA